MDTFGSRYYGMNENFLWVIGLWPYETSYKRFFLLSFSALFSGLMLISQMIYLCKYINDVDSVFQIMPTYLACSINLARLFYLLHKSEELKALLDQMYDDWNNSRMNTEMEILKKYARNSRKYTLAYATFVIIPVLFFFLSPLYSTVLDVFMPLNETRPRNMLYQGEYFVDQEEHYYKLLIFQYSSSLVVVLVVISVDTTYVMFIEHLCGTLDVLSFRLENIAMHNIYVNYTCKTKKNAHQNVIQCIHLYSRTKKFIELYESIFGLLYLLDVSVGFIIHSSSSVICVIRMKQFSEITDVLYFAGLTTAQSVRLSYLCWVGQILIDTSNKIYLAAYSGAWYEMPVKTRKLIIFFIMRSQVPHRLRIVKLLTINFETLRTILKTSLSFSTVIAAIR